MDGINFDIMRYELDNEGYVEKVFFGCASGKCKGYTGKTPEGYETLDEWAENENIRAYKIVDGNLVYDANRDYKLKLIQEKEEDENRHITKKEMGIAATEEIRPFENIYPNLTTEGSYINSANSYDNLGNFSTEKVELWNYVNQDIDFVELEFVGRNFLPNTASDTINNGIEYTMNIDKTINISGTATDKSVLNLAGTDTSVRHILTFKRGETLEETDGFSNVYYDYVVSGLTDEMSLEFYNYDGVDRTLVGIYKNNDVIRFEQDTNVTQVLLTIEKGTSIDTKIAPMMFLANGMLQHPVLPMKKYKGNLLSNNLQSQTLNDITFTVNADKSVSVKGTATKNTNVWLDNGFTLPKGTYTLSGCPANGSASTYKLDIMVGTTYYQDNGKGVTFTIGEDTKIEYVRILMYSGQTVDFTYYPMIEEGLTANEYKVNNGRNGQYYVDGVSTQEVRSGKNLFNKSYLVNYGIGENKIVYNWSAHTFYTKINPNTTYTISRTFNGLRFMVGTTQEIPNVNVTVSDVITNNTAKSITITTNSNAQYLVFYIYNSYVDTDTTLEQALNRVQVELGTTATEIEAYGVAPSPDYPSEIINIYKAGTYNTVINGKIYEISINDDLRGLSNGVSDRLWFDANGNNGIDIDKKIGSIVLNGSETIELDDVYNGISQFAISVSNMKKETNSSKYIVISNYFKGTCFGNSWTKDNVISNVQNLKYIRIMTSKFATVDEFKTWLSTHNTEVYYELATYTTTSIPEYYSYDFEYEEYKNNTTLIDLANNKFERFDSIVIENNQAYLVKEGAVIYTDENGNEIDAEKETIFLGYVSMPRTYTPYTNCYSHQRVMVHSFTYRDPRNIDITKIDLKGLVLITDVETDYNFREEDLTRVQNYIMGTGDLTNEELDVYDINGDGVVTSYDYVLISGMINGTISNKVTGELEINSTQSKRTIVLKDKDGKILTSVGMNGISTPALSVNGVLVEENIKEEETPTTQLLNGKRIYKRLYTGTMPVTSGTTENLFSLDFDFHNVWIDESLSFIYKDTETLGTNWMYATDDYLRMWVNKSNRQMKYKSGKSLSSFTYNIVLAYTKSDGTEEEPEEPKEEIIEVNKTSNITGSTSDNAKWTFKTVATETKIDTVNKTSTVTIANYIGRPSSNKSSYFAGNLTINYKCGDQTFSETVYRNSGTISSGGWYKLGSHTFTIEHTTEPMNINVGGSMSTSEFNPNSASASGTITLTEI